MRQLHLMALRALYHPWDRQLKMCATQSFSRLGCTVLRYRHELHLPAQVYPSYITGYHGHRQKMMITH